MNRANLLNQLARMNVPAAALSSATAARNRLPPAKPQPGPVSSQAQLMSPEDLPYMDRQWIPGYEHMPFDVGGTVKPLARGVKPWKMSKEAYHRANPHDPGAGREAMARGDEFDRLPDDAEVWVFHATDTAIADDMVKNGVRQANKPWNLSREQYEQGVRGGSAGRFAPGKGLGGGIYVGASPLSIEGYGRNILAIRTTKKKISTPPEQEFFGKSPGRALADSDAMILGDIRPGDIMDVTPPPAGPQRGRYVYGHEGFMNAAKNLPPFGGSP